MTSKDTLCPAAELLSSFGRSADAKWNNSRKRKITVARGGGGRRAGGRFSRRPEDGGGGVWKSGRVSSGWREIEPIGREYTGSGEDNSCSAWINGEERTWDMGHQA